MIVLYDRIQHNIQGSGVKKSKRERDDSDPAKPRKNKKQKFGSNQREADSQSFTQGNGGEATKNLSGITCYGCNKKGHYKTDCLKLKNPNHVPVNTV